MASWRQVHHCRCERCTSPSRAKNHQLFFRGAFTKGTAHCDNYALVKEMDGFKENAFYVNFALVKEMEGQNENISCARNSSTLCLMRRCCKLEREHIRSPTLLFPKRRRAFSTLEHQGRWAISDRQGETCGGRDKPLPAGDVVLLFSEHRLRKACLGTKQEHHQSCCDCAT